MKGSTNNGSTKEKSGRNKNSLTSHSTKELGSAKAQGRNDGIEQDRINQPHSSRATHDREVQQPSSDTGEILERLEFIESEYLSYLEADQQQLEARLEGNKQRKEVFKSSMQKLEQEVRRLISENETSD